MDPKEKRKRVMGRSIKLGHCVCDPKKPCPCPLFNEKNICTCAGERETVESGSSEVRLTDFVRSAGCASKIGQKDLHQVLKMLPTVSDPRLLVGISTADDAGVFQLTEDTAVVQTVDVFTPGVNDPHTFGRIAACNSLSDVYAMGGKPVTALSIIGFPIYSLPHEVMAEIIKGGMEVLKEAGTILVGGHSINDEEIKFGFAVTGLIGKDSLVTNSGARPGDVVVLTKALGTGIISLADQIEKASPEAKAALAESMSTLNRIPAEIMTECGAHACTDVTGFGLLGHLSQVVKESGVTVEINTGALPLLPSVMEYAEAGMYSGANERNAEYSAPVTEYADDVPEHVKAILYDAQTSGGLLIFFPADRVDEALRKMHDQGVTYASVIGRVTEESDGRIVITTSTDNLEKPIETQREDKPEPTAGTEENTMTEDLMDEACCTHDAPAGQAGDPIQKFKNFISSTLQPGAIDVVSKELIALALSIGVQCEPCSKMHVKKARQMGIGKEEIEEAAAIAIAFGGCRSLMLWMALKKEFQDILK